MANVTDAQQKAFVLVPKLTAAASVVGSSLILFDVVVKRRRRRCYSSTTPTTSSRRLFIKPRNNSSSNKYQQEQQHQQEQENTNNKDDDGSTVIPQQQQQQQQQRRMIRKQRHSSSLSSSSIYKTTPTTTTTTRHRLLAGMSCFDIISSTGWFCTTWPIDESIQWTIWNIGNQRTCSAQGFFVQLGALGTVLYNGCLALYYLLVIRYGMTDDTLSRRIEPYMHLFVGSGALGTSITGLILGLYNPIGWMCTIQAYPPWCLQSYKKKSDNEIAGPPCERGDNARLYHILFIQIPVMVVMIFLIISMVSIFCKIRQAENNVMAHAVRPGRLQRRFALGAICYVGAMFVTWTIFIAVNTYFDISGNRVNWWLSFWAATLLPCQGIMNGLIYFYKERQSTSLNNKQSSSERRVGGGSCGSSGGVSGSDAAAPVAGVKRRGSMLPTALLLQQSGSMMSRWLTPPNNNITTPKSTTIVQRSC